MNNAMVPAYVLHRRKYRETSLLVDLLTQDSGIIRVVANGACRAKSPWRGILQSFIPLLVSWSAKRELGTLKYAEVSRYVPSLQGRYLLSGLYVNELIIRLIHPHAPVLELFQAYQTLHQQLGHVSQLSVVNHNADWQKYLRLFEKRLLTVLGVSLDFNCDCYTGEAILPTHYYRFIPDKGFVCHSKRVDSNIKLQLFAGDSLLSLASEKFTTQHTLHDAKRLMRLILRPLLGYKPLHSRALF